jgi:peptide/nickel transport system substrate-binding protein
VQNRPTRRALHSRLVAALMSLALVAAACGGGGDDDTPPEGGPTTSGGTTGTGGGPAEEGKPTPGGKVVYAQEAEVAGGLCLPEAQLDISGINYARTIYDTLTAPNENGEIVPFLAQSVEPNATYDEWTITLREGITFHDGTALDSTVVKNNLDAYRGQYPARSPLLFAFVFSNVDTVTAPDPLTVVVTTKTPWAAFPVFLFASGRVGMMAQVQLDSTSCAQDAVGTGPFMLEDWVIGDHFTAVKNPNYWGTDADGVQLPYLDEIEFRPIPEGQQRTNALTSGQVQAMHTSGAIDIEQLRQIRDEGTIGLLESDEFGEVNHYMLNVTKPPFDNMHARLAFAYALNRPLLNEVRARGILTLANGPFAPGSMGSLEDSGFPEYDLAKAQEEVALYEEETGLELEFTLGGTPDPEGVQTQNFVKGMMEEAGMTVTLSQTEQAQYISDAIARNFSVNGWRNFPGTGDPDSLYVWWHCNNGAAAPEPCDNPVNFGGFNSPEISRLLDEGRVESDPAVRQQIYEDLTRQFAEELWLIWTNYTLWAIGTQPNVHGILGPDLPDGGGGPFPGLATGHPMSGIWIEQ